jgi:hypothetical protein
MSFVQFLSLLGGMVAMKQSLAGALMLFFVGCGGSSDAPSLAKVSGVVNFKDAPLPEATVTFYPEKGPVSMGKTDANGAYQLRTNGQLGAVVGSHKVTVSSDEKEAEIPPMDGNETKHGGAKSSLPKKYSDPATTDLEVSVPDSGNANLVLDLTE